VSSQVFDSTAKNAKLLSAVAAIPYQISKATSTYDHPLSQVEAELPGSRRRIGMLVKIRADLSPTVSLPHHGDRRRIYKLVF